MKDKSIINYIERLLRNLYVDDSINSFDQLTDCIDFYKVAKSILAEGGCELGKWKSNNISLQRQLSSIEANALQDDVLHDNSTKSNFTKVLGLN